jgi:DNA-binding Lrp family transcriptional regulator
MDAVDRKILAVLQENGRLTVTELAAHVGLSVSPCHRRLRELERDTVVSFEEAVAGVPHVVQAQRLFGDPDYLLRVVTTDLAAYQQLYDEKLIALPGVQRMASTLVMKRVVHDRPLPA